VKQQAGGRPAILKKQKRPVIPWDVVTPVELESLKEMRSKQFSPEFEVFRPFLYAVPYFPNRPIDLSMPCHQSFAYFSR
jgi:hypothetical protein